MMDWIDWCGIVVVKVIGRNCGEEGRVLLKKNNTLCISQRKLLLNSYMGHQYLCCYCLLLLLVLCTREQNKKRKETNLGGIIVIVLVLALLLLLLFVKIMFTSYGPYHGGWYTMGHMHGHDVRGGWYNILQALWAYPSSFVQWCLHAFASWSNAFGP